MATHDNGILVEFGNPTAHKCVVDSSSASAAHDHEVLDRDGASVTYLHIPAGYTVDPDASVADLALHLARLNPSDPVTRLPGNEAFLVAAHPQDGMWRHHGAELPSWVASDHAGLASLLGEFYDIPVHDLADESFHRAKEDSHHTHFGPPGVGPATLGAQMLKVNSGNDIQSRALGGGQVGATGQASAATSTTLTTGSTYTTNQWAGYRVYASVSATQMVFGIIVSNTNAASASVLTVDRWYTVATPGGAAGSTPSSTATFVITDGNAPAWFIGLTATATAPSSTDTSLTGEITTVGGGLIRKIAPYAQTAGVASYTLTPVFTANGTDTLSVTIAQMATFTSMVSTDTTSTMLFRTLLNANATLTASGDQLTVTQTVTE